MRPYKKKIFKLAKGFRGKGKNCYTVAKPRVYKALTYAYRDRKVKKRDMRGLWIQRINAASREYGMSYSHLMFGLAKSDVALNRKMLAELAVTEPQSFQAIAGVAAQNLVRSPTAHPPTQSYPLTCLLTH
jgi:large subunit ribosomal protein L20